MRSRRRADRMPVNGEINVVSLIDVMMLLMVIFMITAPIMQGGVDIQLPKADVRPLEAKNGLVVSIDRTGQIFVDDKRFTFDEFRRGIKALSDRKGGGGVSVRGDATLQWQRMMQVIGAMTKAGITEIGLIAEPEPEG